MNRKAVNASCLDVMSLFGIHAPRSHKLLFNPQMTKSVTYTGMKEKFEHFMIFNKFVLCDYFCLIVIKTVVPQY